MHRRTGAASVLAAVLVAAALAPILMPRPAAAAGACGTYRSETVPPTTIRVFRTATGAVDTIDFRTYAKNVSGWHSEQQLSPEEEEAIASARP